MSTASVDRAGSSSVTVPLSVPGVERDVVQRLDEIAREQHRSRAAEIRHVLTLYANGSLVAGR